MRRADHSLTFIVACGPESTRAVFSSAQINISVLQVFKLIIKVSINSVLSINLWQLDSIAFELLRCKFLVDQIVYFSFTFKRRRNGKILLQRWRIEAIIHDIRSGALGKLTFELPEDRESEETSQAEVSCEVHDARLLPPARRQRTSDFR